jgi:hypothetical protein
MAALDDIDGIDLHIAEMGDRICDSPGPLPERRALVQPLGVQPDLPGLCRRERKGLWCAGHCTAQCKRDSRQEKQQEKERSKRQPKKKPRCHLLTTRPDDARRAYFIDIAFCDFM